MPRKNTEKLTQAPPVDLLAVVNELSLEQNTITEAMTELADFEIDSASDMQIAANLLNDIVARRDRIDARLAEITEPQRRAEKSARDLFRPVQNAISTAEQWLRERLKAARTKHVARNKKLLEDAHAARQAGDPHLATALLLQLQSEQAPDGIQFRETWTFEVVDEAAVPREHLQVDAKSIAAAVKAAKGQIEIPGVRVMKDTTVVASG